MSVPDFPSHRPLLWTGTNHLSQTWRLPFKASAAGRNLPALPRPHPVLLALLDLPMSCNDALYSLLEILSPRQLLPL